MNRTREFEHGDLVRFRVLCYAADPDGASSFFGPFRPGDHAVILKCVDSWTLILVDNRLGWIYTNEVEFVQSGDSDE
jgi:hypothetical protein